MVTRATRLQTNGQARNCSTVFQYAGDRPYLVSGADDKLAKVWDYQTKACVQTLEGHSHNVSAVCFHPELPVILTGKPPACLPLYLSMQLFLFYYGVLQHRLLCGLYHCHKLGSYLNQDHLFMLKESSLVHIMAWVVGSCFTADPM